MSINDMSKEIQELKDKLRRCDYDFKEIGRNIMHKEEIRKRILRGNLYSETIIAFHNWCDNKGSWADFKRKAQKYKEDWHQIEFRIFWRDGISGCYKR